jgi:hypothetical protein
MFYKLYDILSTITITTLFIEPISDISFYPNNLLYTSSSTRVALKISRACFENSTNMIKTIFPDSFIIKPEFKQGWTTNLQTNSISNNYFSNITWSSNDISNNIPDEFNELFWVWITYPSTYNLDTKYYAPTIQYCYPSGQYKWIDTTTPSEYLAPYFTITSSTVSNNEDDTIFSRLNVLTISTAIISIISLLMNFVNEYRNYTNKKYQSQLKEKINVPEKLVEFKDILIQT